MNDNPFETPNPLNNQNLNTPPQPTNRPQAPINAQQPIMSSAQRGPINAPQKPIMSTPEEPVSGQAPIVSAPQESANIQGSITSTPEEPVSGQAPIVSQPQGPVGNEEFMALRQANLATESPVKQKKTGLIVGIVMAILVFIGAIVAVSFLLLGSNSGDHFNEAIAKILNGNTPKKVKIDGNISVDIAEDSMFSAMLDGVSNINLQINSKMNLLNFENDSSIGLSLINSGQENKVDLEEKYLADKGLYIKINSLELPNMELPEEMKEKWLQTSFNATESFDSVTVDAVTNIMSCISNDFSKIDLAKFYKANTFLMSSQENILIERKNNPIYRINVDYEKFAGFMNSLLSTEETANIIFGCTEQIVNNTSRVYTVTADDVKSTIPEEFYVEINDKNDITRFYLKNSIAELNADYVIDLSIEALETLDVAAPADAVSLEEIILGGQGSRNNTQRRNDMALVDTALVQYQTNNTGNLPNSDDVITSASVWQAGISGSTNCGENEACNFVQDYMNSDTENTFMDPDGTPYSVVITCNWANPDCDRGAANGTSELAPTGDEDGTYTIKDANNGLAFDAHTIYIVPGGRCKNNGVIESAKRHVAVLYRFENAGVYCIDNQ